MSNEPRTGGVKTTKTVFRIIEEVQESNGATLSELADRLDLATSTVHDHLSTLVKQRYLVKEDKSYRIALKFLDHGVYAKNRNPLTKVSTPALNRLADETGEVAWLAVEEYGEVVYLDKVAGEKAVQTHGRIGKRDTPHSIASGKAILAFMPEERVHEIIDQHGMSPRTSKTIVDKETLFEELAEVRKTNVAFNREERIRGVRAVFSPIEVDEDVFGSIGIAGPSSRLKGNHLNQTLPDQVRESASELELRIKYELEEQGFDPSGGV